MEDRFTTKGLIEEKMDFHGGVELIQPLVIKFYADINKRSINELTSIIDEQKRLYLYNKIKYGVSIPLTIKFTTGGGLISDGFVLIDYLNSLKKESIAFNIIPDGYVFSMGLVILMSFIDNIKTKGNVVCGSTIIRGEYFGQYPVSKNNVSESYADVLATKLHFYISQTLGFGNEVASKIVDGVSFTDYSDFLKFLGK